MNFDKVVRPDLNPDGSVPGSWYDEDYFEHGAASGKLSWNGNDYNENIEACKLWATDCYNRWGPFESFLELGCGRGWNFYGFLHLPELKLQKMMGVDISHYAIDTANPIVRPLLIEHDISDLAFIPDKSFDTIFSNDVMEHLTPTQLENCFAHCRRIAKKRIAHLVSIGQNTDEPFGLAPANQDTSHVSMRSTAWWAHMFLSFRHEDGWLVNMIPHGTTVEFDIKWVGN